MTSVRVRSSYGDLKVKLRYEEGDTMMSVAKLVERPEREASKTVFRRVYDCRRHTSRKNAIVVGVERRVAGCNAALRKRDETTRDGW